MDFGAKMNFYTAEWLLQLVVLLCLCLQKVQPCGGFLKDITSATISTPNYPDNYADESHCIWFVQAKKNHSLILNITSGFAGESNCDDYLRVTNGNSNMPSLYDECDNSAPAVIYSNTRWLWVKFFSDNRVNNTGFTASLTTISDPDSANAPGDSVNYTSPHKDCQSVHFSCANKECISAAYRCDSQQDCGCSGEGCDEHDCGGLSLALNARIAIGIVVGCIIFTAVFGGIGALEYILKKRSEDEYKRKVKEARIRARKKKKDQNNDPKRQDSISDRSRPSTANPISRKNSSIVPPSSRKSSTVTTPRKDPNALLKP